MLRCGVAGIEFIQALTQVVESVSSGRIGSQETFVPAACIVGDGCRHSLNHQAGDEVLPGRRLFLNIVDHQMPETLAEIALKFGMADKLSIKYLDQKRKIEQVVSQAFIAEMTSGAGRFLQVDSLFLGACPTDDLASRRLFQGQAV